MYYKPVGDKKISLQIIRFATHCTLFSTVACATTKDSTSNANAEVGSDTAGQDSSFIYEPPDPSACDATLTMDKGWLCAIQPSRLDPGARDQYSNDSLADKNLGFGYHVVAFPHAEQTVHGVYVHLTGSMGRPYHPVSRRFPSKILLNEAMAAGYVTLQVAYHNRYSVNSEEECIGSHTVDDCAGLVRYEKITGEDVGPVVEVPLSDSITQRIQTVVAYLESSGFAFPVEVVSGGTINWATLRVGGHSQGAGHALYIAKYWDSARSCLLGGPYDVADSRPSIPLERIADWYLDDSADVDITKIRALVSVNDDNYDQFVSAYELIGLEEGIHWTSFFASSYRDNEGNDISGHGAAVHDPAFANQRHDACFEQFGQ